MSLTYEPVGDPIAVISDIETEELKLVYVDQDGEPEEKKSQPSSLMDYCNSVIEGEDLDHLVKCLMQGMTIAEIATEPEEEESLYSQSDMREIDLEPTEEIQVLPSTLSERVLIAGPSGCRKSTWAATYAKNWLLQNPGKEVVLFCRTEDDPAYNLLECDEVEVTEDIYEATLPIEDFKEKLVIFDDMDNLPWKDAKKFIHVLCNDLMANGRKLGIYVVYVSHTLMRGLETKVINNESNKVVLFNGCGDKQNLAFLKEYASMETKQARAITQIKCRWFCLNRNIPRYIIHEKGVILL